MIDRAVVTLLISVLSGTGAVATWVDLNEEVVINKGAIESVEKVHSIEMGYIKAELSEIKQLIKDSG